MTIRTFVTAIVATSLVVAATATRADVYLLGTSAEQHVAEDLATAKHASDTADDRLLIVNGNNGRVVYDDGNNDLFCVTRNVVVGYNEYGYRIRKRIMRCR
jgi:ribonucleotide monophosphatase NagD (HAD superfamily)